MRGLAVVALAAGLTVAGGCSAGTPAGSNPAAGSAVEDEAAKITVAVTIDSSAVDSPVSASAEVALPEGATVYDALNALAEQEDLSVNTAESSYGAYVSAIGGLAERDHGDMSGWTFTVNDEQVNESASSCELQDGDTVTWTYVTEF